MHRTHLYLDDRLWNALQARAAAQKTSISELVREAVRERYFNSQYEQKKAMQEFVGAGRDNSMPIDALESVRELRKDTRLERFQGK